MKCIVIISQFLPKKKQKNVLFFVSDQQTWEISKGLVIGSFWREANTRRPTLPPSALTFEVNTAAARRRTKSPTIINDRRRFSKIPRSYRWQHQEHHVGPAAFRWQKRFILQIINKQHRWFVRFLLVLCSNHKKKTKCTYTSRFDWISIHDMISVDFRREKKNRRRRKLLFMVMVKWF